MITCKYYDVFKGKVSCKHPTYGEERTKLYGDKLYQQCKLCKYECGGIYPSDIPKDDKSDYVVDVVDKDGNITKLKKKV